MDLSYIIFRSKRKTITISIDKNLNIVVKAPYFTSDETIKNIVDKNKQWISEQIEVVKNKNHVNEKFSENDIKLLKAKAKDILTQKTSYYARIMNVSPISVKITSAKTRWGSCSYDNKISYSWRVMLLNDECQNYIIVHELCHIKVKNHSKDFYNEVCNILPNYKQLQKQIKNYYKTEINL